MKKTNHVRNRMRHRNIHESVLDLLLSEGVPLTENPDRLLLTTRHLKALIVEGLIDRRLAQRAEKSLPLVGVVKGNMVITVFRPTRTINRNSRRPSRTRRATLRRLG